jgi:hypothetical protein
MGRAGSRDAPQPARSVLLGDNCYAAMNNPPLIAPIDYVGEHQNEKHH